MFRISENRPYQEIIWLSIYKTWKFQVQNMSHALPRASRRSGNLCLNEHALSRASILIHTLTRAGEFSHADTRHDVMDDVIIH